MAAYGDTDDFEEVVHDPVGGGWFTSATYAADYEAIASKAAVWIDGKIGYLTRTPVPASSSVIEAIKRVEALIVASWRASAILTRNSGFPEDSAFRRNFLREAEGLLGEIIFPATATAPVADPDNTHSGVTFTATAYDETTIDSRWRLVCTESGSETTAQFSVLWGSGDSKSGIWYAWDFADSAVFPTDKDDQTMTDMQGIFGQVYITKSGTGSFTKGQAWTFRTHARTKMVQSQGIRLVSGWK